MAAQHYELVSEPTLFAAQRALADEIEPETEHLLRRVEQHLAKMERREKSLVSKAGLQEQRIEQSRPRLDQPSSGFGGGGGGVFAEREAREIKERLKTLRNKRARLEGTVDRLQMQMLHKERALKMRTHYAGQE
jgi:DASH complex subunit SPC19